MKPNLGDQKFVNCASRRPAALFRFSKGVAGRRGSFDVPPS